MGVIKFYYVITGRLIKQASKQAKNVFERKIMILRNITWIHSLIRIEVIKRCCSIHVFRNSLILILYNIIKFTYSTIQCLITLICLIILISHIAKVLLILSVTVSVQVRIFPLNMRDIIIHVAQ